MCNMSTGANRSQKTVLVSDRCGQPCWFRELIPGPLKEQQVPLTAEPFLQPPRFKNNKIVPQIHLLKSSAPDFQNVTLEMIPSEREEFLEKDKL